MNSAYNLLKSKTFWTLVIGAAYNVYAAYSSQLPPVVTLGVNALVAYFAPYFHIQAVNKAAIASANATAATAPGTTPTPVSGQQ